MTEWLCPKDEQVLALAADLAKHPNDPLLGCRIGDQFLLVARVGEGGFGVVYRAIQVPVGRVVAVKVLKETARQDPSGAARFFQEARAIGALRHPATVKLVSAGESPRRGGRSPWIYIAMEFIEGPTLKDIIQDKGPVSSKRTVEIAAEVLSALGEAHRKGIVHRDLKPENIILEPDEPGPPRIRVVDFGISKVLKAADAIRVASIHTRRGFIVGTTSYAAPERVLGHDARPTSDLYSMGVMLFEMLTGELPFGGESAQAVLRAHVESPIPEIPRKLKVPQPLQAEVRRALSKRPEERRQTAEALGDALLASMGLRPKQRASGKPRGGTSLDLPEAAPSDPDSTVKLSDSLLPQVGSLLVGDKATPKHMPLPAEPERRAVGSGPDTAPYMRPGQGETLKGSEGPPARRGPDGTRLITQRGGQPPARKPSWQVALIIGGLMGAIGAAISWGVARSETPSPDGAPTSERSHRAP